MERRDIINREDIIRLVNRFYEQVKEDEVIGFIFNEVARVDWQKHLPIMYDFWEGLLLDSNAYTRRVMEPHFRLNQQLPLEPPHFTRWLQLFESTVNELFEGEKAKIAITRARSIKGIMEFKMNAARHPQENKNIPLVNPGNKK
ncbi:group III truncated hemoglobin [Chitinophaga vietnamensis]|uniref:group III truncated hemoglobin n=1 Tax=Chitinophaga vietnamensis TaxID=2593957 RepID=UPI0011775EDC|nr:group III truncated hemoglobin [Chitinophaga vietnamensis]